MLEPPHCRLPADSFLEWAFLRWVLAPATDPAIVDRVAAQREVDVDGRRYRLDYEIAGDHTIVAVELDGYAFHSSRDAFTYDRLRQNDVQATGRAVIRFSYDAIRHDTARCVAQLQAVLARDPALASQLNPAPVIETPDMDPDPVHALDPAPGRPAPAAATPADGEPAGPSYFDEVRGRLEQKTLRDCQTQAFSALANFYGSGGRHAACVMSVGAGKTALGVASSLAFTRRRALVVTPGSVIRGTFDRAFDHQAVGNVLYGLPGGPLIPGSRPPRVLTLDADEGPIRGITRHQLLDGDVLVTNFHSLGDGSDPDHLLSKLQPGDIDFIVVDEAHIAASASYQRAFAHFPDARALLMSACFQRLDGKPIDADVVYRYRLIDSIADGNAKNLRVHRFAPDSAQTTYEMVWPDGAREEITGRDQLLAVLGDDRKLARITAKSTEPIRQVMRVVRDALDRQAELLHPVKPRVLFSALGERHAEQIARIATEHGITSAHLHHSMTPGQIRDTRAAFEQDAGNLQGLVQLKMLGQGYDFPPICVVVPMRPYGSFSECYQFIGRGIRVIHHPALTGRVAPGGQILDVVYHAELGIDDHIDTIYAENDMDPITEHADVDAMEARGAWALPDRETVTAGWANFAWWIGHEPRFGGSLADDERRKITLRANPAGTFAWAAVTPVFELLCVPHDLRAAKAGKAEVTAQQKAWKPLDAMLAACDIDLTAELAPFRPRSGWSRMTAAEHATARQALVAGWARHATPDVAARLRMWMLGGLVDRFYANAKTATPTSRQALTKAHWRPMAAVFAGDWLGFLEYLGEQPNPFEEIASSLPEPKLYVGGADRARQAAAAAGVDPAEVERMLASFFGHHDASSPVDRRVAALRRTWQALDELHAAHEPAAGTLWGVLDERDEVHDTRFDDQYRKGLHRQVLPADLNAQIAELWGTQATSKDPCRLVSAWLPHHGAWDALGAAVALWHEISLTAFALTETTGYGDWGLSEAAERHQPCMDELNAASCPVDPAVFRELAETARSLGPVGHEQHRSRVERDGIAIELNFGGGDRLPRPGFDRLRDIITRHRRAWADAHLDRWLQHRWQSDLRAAAEAFNRRLLANGKPPTVRQSIGASQPALDRWFGGRIGDLLTAIGQQGPSTQPVYERRLPADPYAFGRAIEHALGGGLREPDMTDWELEDRARLAEHRRIRDHNSARYYAAFSAYDYVRSWEALGAQPQMRQVKGGKSAAEFLDRSDPTRAWIRLEEAILKVLADPASQQVAAPALPFANGRRTRPSGAGPAPAAGVPKQSDNGPAAAPAADPPHRRGLLRRMLNR